MRTRWRGFVNLLATTTTKNHTHIFSPFGYLENIPINASSAIDDKTTPVTAMPLPVFCLFRLMAPRTRPATEKLPSPKIVSLSHCESSSKASTQMIPRVSEVIGTQSGPSVVC